MKSLMVGAKVNQYRILEKIDEGGMGVVYKALDTSLNRNVALKFIHNQFTKDKSIRRRFILEARAASALDHANICTIHEIGESDAGQLFMPD